MKNIKKKNSQVSFLSNNLIEDEQIEAAKAILLEAGYKVSKLDITTKLTTINGVKDYFYYRLYQKYPDLYENRVNNIERDMRFAKLFVEARMKDGSIGKLGAIQECVHIIDTLFDNESEFMFKIPIKDITVLGQGKLSWITQKAIELINKKRYKDMEKKSEELFKKLEEDLKVDLNCVSDKLSRMLINMEG